MNAANIISLARLLSVPVTVWLMLSGQWLAAFGLFVAAGISDAIDGLLAKRFGMQSDLGGFLDPLADKALLVSIYVTLGAQGHIPNWLPILVVSRDVLIVGGVLLSFAMAIPQPIRPIFVSKANTAAQIALAAMVLADLSSTAADLRPLIDVLVYGVGATTILSGAGYVIGWARHQDDPGRVA